MQTFKNLTPHVTAFFIEHVRGAGYIESTSDYVAVSESPTSFVTMTYDKNNDVFIVSEYIKSSDDWIPCPHLETSNYHHALHEFNKYQASRLCQTI